MPQRGTQPIEFEISDPPEIDAEPDLLLKGVLLDASREIGVSGIRDCGGLSV